ncbi:MAG: hypothetical protein Q9165_005118 [Trypethelium subeluteriae]
MAQVVPSATSQQQPSPYPQLPPMRAHTPFDSTNALTAAPADDPGRSSFESVDLAAPHAGLLGGDMGAGVMPLGAGNTDSYGGISAHDWALETAAATATAARGPPPPRPPPPSAAENPFLNPAYSDHLSAAATASFAQSPPPSRPPPPSAAENPFSNPSYSDHLSAAVAAAPAAAPRPRPSDESIATSASVPSISTAAGSALGGSMHSLPSPVFRVLEAHGGEARPLHPLEREMARERAASISTAGGSDDADGGGGEEEHSPLMERAGAGGYGDLAGGRGHEELWGAKEYQRVETDDV